MDYFSNAEHSRIGLSIFGDFFTNNVYVHCKF